MKLRKKMFISYAILDIYNEYVAPRAGAWIETLNSTCFGRAVKSRPSRRGVD